MRSNPRSLRGFTLVEISIVLVIIGLVLGGVLVGRDMIRAAELRKINTSQQNIITAITTFKLKYNCLPGDCASATQFFGTDPEGCSGGLDKTPKTQTCNGNGNGKINTTPDAEFLLIWQHLSAANLISGLFSASAQASPADGWQPDYNCPRILSYSFCFSALDGLTANTEGLSVVPLPSDAMIFHMRQENLGIGGLLTPEDALQYEQKFDDGIPDSGKVLSQGTAFTPNCTSSASGTLAYDTTVKNKECMFYYLTPY
jgi:prepilin-type N-terminal cleavage/methylation domain-containing protein